jgi:membrane associated rhomboid family serine protease
MIPLRDVIPSRTTPVVTVSLIALNLLAWVFELTLPADALPGFLRLYGVVPSDLRIPTLASSMFLHASWSHVIANMWYLWIFGDNIEDRMGHARFLVFYLLCGVVAALGHVVMSPQSLVPAIGASGAITGVMGAYFALFPRSRVLTLVPLIVFVDIVEIPALALLGLWLVIQIFSAGIGAIATAGDSGGIAFVAHVAGFAAGAAGVFVFRKRREEWGREIRN